MPPVISKLVDAQEPGAMLTPDLVVANESPVGDSKLAYIIADIISNLKSQQSQSNKTKRACKYPCSVCSKSVNKNQKAIQFDHCNSWSHASCNGISKSEYESLVQEDESIPSHCLPCQTLNCANIFPFSFLSRSELLDINGVDLPSQLTNLLPFEISSRLNNLPNLNDFDLDQNLDSKYRKVSKLSSTKTNQTFSLFHVNIRRLTKHFDELQTLINSAKIPFDILGITESKQLVGTKFPVNVNMDGYQIYSHPTKSTHGGVVMYVNKKSDHVVKEDISVLGDEFETLWIEIKTGAKAKNILCCCVYRHPNTDTKKFVEHMDDVLSKLEKNNKTIFLMGDFNINLLSYEYYIPK